MIERTALKPKIAVGAGFVAGRRLKVLLAGEEPIKSAPLLSLAQTLRGRGIEIIFSEGAEWHSTSSWLTAVRNCDIVVWVNYHGPDPYLTKQLALAVALGRPLIRWWVGSDVLYCLCEPETCAGAQLTDRLSVKNIAVAPHLVTELSSIGIKARTIPSVVEPVFSRATVTDAPPPGAILVYLPASRAAFYGEAIVGRAVRANPELKFVIVGDEEHRFREFRNVESLGWVSDMKAVYDRIGCVLRVTEHDGLPRMVLEALFLGKYVIYSHDLRGTWRARDYSEVQNAIERFQRTNAPNWEGRVAVNALFTPAPETELVSIIKETVGERAWGKRLRAFAMAANLTVRCRIRSLKKGVPQVAAQAG